MRKNITRYILLHHLIVLPVLALGQITGKVFDYDGVATRGNKSATKENSISNITIKAYGIAETGKL